MAPAETPERETLTGDRRSTETWFDRLPGRAQTILTALVFVLTGAAIWIMLAVMMPAPGLITWPLAVNDCWRKDSPLTASPALLSRFQNDLFAVVTARHVTNCLGWEGKKRDQPLWYVNGVGRDARASGSWLHGSGTAAPKVVVVFVHGYNTAPDTAVRYGQNLLKLIAAANAEREALTPRHVPNTSIAGVAFLWRGDFSEARFIAARSAAEITAPVFADFIRVLRTDFPSARLVVIAHSLGAYLSLEAIVGLGESPQTQPSVDSLTLLQGAVPAYSLHTWEVSYYWAPDLDKVVVREQCTGRYALHKRAIGQLIYTTSPRDEALTNSGRYYVPEGGVFSFAQVMKPLPVACTIPMQGGVDRTAIGGRFNAGTRWYIPPPPQGTPARPPLPEPGTPYLPITGPSGREPALQLPRLSSKYDRWMVDPSFLTIALPAGADGHSSILTNDDQFARRAVREIWTSIHDAFPASKN